MFTEHIASNTKQLQMSRRRVKGLGQSGVNAAAYVAVLALFAVERLSLILAQFMHVKECRKLDVSQAFCKFDERPIR